MITQIMNLPEGMYSSELPLEFHFCDFYFGQEYQKLKVMFR